MFSQAWLNIIALFAVLRVSAPSGKRVAQNVTRAPCNANAQQASRSGVPGNRPCCRQAWMRVPLNSVVAAPYRKWCQTEPRRR